LAYVDSKKHFGTPHCLDRKPGALTVEAQENSNKGKHGIGRIGLNLPAI
jgi:hypothetical protein